MTDARLDAAPLAAVDARPTARRRRAFWLKQAYLWHWMSAAICLVGMLLFTATGITLNHAAEIEARPTITERKAAVPEALRADLGAGGQGRRPLPNAVQSWLRHDLGIDVAGRDADWSEREIYLGLPRPGGDALISIERTTGALVHEHTDRGWVSWLNDLHKGRNTGTAWRWFIDLFAIACLVFCITGVILLQIHAAARRSTWPLVGLGLAIPAVLALFFLH